MSHTIKTCPVPVFEVLVIPQYHWSKPHLFSNRHTMRRHVFFRQWGNGGLVERYSMRVHIQQTRPLPMALKFVTVWHMTPNGPKEAAGLPTSLLWTTNRSIVKALLTYQVQGIIGRGGQGVV